MTNETDTSWMMIERYGERLRAHASGALYWARKRWLIISDLHLGKGMHFRKKGMAVPAHMDTIDIKRLAALIEDLKPHQVILLGDLFHSDYNVAWERFAQFTCDYRAGLFVLVRGNHDILSEWDYARSNMKIVDDIDASPFYFTHHPTLVEDKINVCGHIHPGIVLRGKARQSTRLPAFFFRANQIIMPAYGRFTGSVNLKIKEDDYIILIVENILLEHTQSK